MQQYVKFAKKIHKKFVRNQNNRKLRDHCCYSKISRSASHGTCNLRFNVANETLVVFRNGSNYDYYFIIKELTNAFEGKFECLGENTVKYNFFSFSIGKKVTKIDKENKNIITIYYKIKFIDIV